MDKRNYFEAYLSKLMDRLGEFEVSGKRVLDDRDFFCKYVWVNVKAMNCINAGEYKTKEETEVNLNLFFKIKDVLSLLTPEEFERMFPIEKEYDGGKYGIKDYFFTKKILRKYEKEKPIIESGNVDELLFDYQNNDIRLFILTGITCVNVLRRLEGLPSIMEEFAEIEGLDTYHKYIDPKTGKAFLIDKNGKTIPLTKPRRHCLKVINGGKR